ncbi:formyltetrahydrofolate deformylase [Amphritea balenae]|uniref:Formyltetrahydrofolate deformylase n=1 Tax=Amphritea balenae TaxID=452629 RepID=A0A3P1SWF0_9GAMM|nr:formyltetrahydrofolate deformylase [Amphritea balenae]RRD00443.1 formyltetrahydrofolate deformylase [Amphritea balenae]GGK70783.1 formyltetrahydrofolate deformylase [Amphritea balenae]
MSDQHWILTAQCPSRLGTIDAVTGLLRQHQLYVTELHSFDDSHSNRFFIRACFNAESALKEDDFRQQFSERASEFEMSWELRPADYKPRVIMLVSKFDHCLNDLLYQYKMGSLNIEIPAIISNHPDLKELAGWYDIPFHHLPITADTKPQQEAQIWQIIQESNAELVVLARYMQVLSAEMCQKLEGWAINIHHSLLPGFKGAKPYHQAYEKGVKTVGATAHYINDDLDEGPIIAQGIDSVDHAYYPDDLVAKGRDIERVTLTRAVRQHVEQRVFLNGNRTVVFAQ